MEHTGRNPMSTDIHTNHALKIASALQHPMGCLERIKLSIVDRHPGLGFGLGLGFGTKFYRFPPLVFDPDLNQNRSLARIDFGVESPDLCHKAVS